MLKNALVAALIAASSLVALPQTASAATTGTRDPIPECWLNCKWIATWGGGGYWICEVQMDCVEP